MKAAVVREFGSVVIEDVPDPVPNDYQAVAQVLCWATCNSTDYKLVQGTMGWNTPLPFVLGHETVGRVIAVGPQVRSYRVGDVLLRVTAVYPGTTMGEYGSALGSFTDIGLATDTEAMKADGLDVSGLTITHFLHQKVPATMDPGDAAMMINLREALSWIKKLKVEGSTVLVVGDGPVGLAFVQAAAVRGAERIILSGHHANRLRLGEEIGADSVINSRVVDTVPAVMDLTNGRGVDVLVDCVGDQKALGEALTVVSADGQVAAYGVPKVPPTGPQPEDPRMVKIATDEPGAHDEVLALIAEKRINPKKFYHDRLHYSQIQQAITRIGRREVLGKVVLDL